MSLETLKPKVAKLIEKAQSGGNTDEWKDFWYEASGVWTTQFLNLFNTNKKIKTLPRLDFKNAKNVSGLCANSSLEKVDYFIDCSNATNGRVMLNACPALTFVFGVNTSKMTNLEHTFSKNPLLETIQEPLDFSSATDVDNCFTNDTGLKNIRFVPETIKISLSFVHCIVLTAESIQSIIGGLATVETAQTLTLHADVKANLTQAQLDTITSKNWNLA